MAANIRTGELHTIARPIHTNEGEVARTAAHIANKDELSVEQLFVGPREMRRYPCVEGRCGFFEQRYLTEPGIGGGLQRKFSCFLVETGRYCQNHLMF